MRLMNEYLKTLRELNVEVIGFRSSGKHIVLQCRAAHGGAFSTTVAKSPSDCRSFLNWRANVRRAATRTEATP